MRNRESDGARVRHEKEEKVMGREFAMRNRTK